MKLIDLYYEWMKTGKIKERDFKPFGAGGLCNAIPLDYLDELLLFKPTVGSGYWAYKGEDAYGNDAMYSFTPERQTIVLLICAMRGEL